MKLHGRLAGYNRDLFRRDLLAGLIVGMIAIPLGMAFAIAIGVKPEYGLYTTVIAGILIAVFGGTRFQIGGPTGAFVPILLAIVMQYGYSKLLIAGFLSGILLILMGFFRLGKAVQFIPRPVTAGFTAGIAVLIFSGQITNALGIKLADKEEHFLSSLVQIAKHLHLTSPYSIAVFIICLAVILLLQRWKPQIPGAFVGMIVSAALALLLFPAHIETIRSAYGPIPNQLPQLQWLNISMDDIKLMLFPAFTIALLGGIESLLSAVVADRMSGTAHNSNRELIGQGIANMATPFFGGIPATGAIARTAANIKHGAASPLSAVIHSLFVLLVVVVFAKLASDIPLASMAPILMLVAWNMSERREFKHLVKTKTFDSVLLLLTFTLTLLTDLITAIWAGMLAALLYYLWLIWSNRKNNNYRVWFVFRAQMENLLADSTDMLAERTTIKVSFQGALSFITASQIKKEMLRLASAKPKHLIIDLSQVPYIDTTGEAMLRSLHSHLQSSGAIGTIDSATVSAHLLAAVRRSQLSMTSTSHLQTEPGC